MWSGGWERWAAVLYLGGCSGPHEKILFEKSLVGRALSRGALARRLWGLHGDWGCSSSELSRGESVLSTLERDSNSPVLIHSPYLEPRASCFGSSECFRWWKVPCTWAVCCQHARQPGLRPHSLGACFCSEARLHTLRGTLTPAGTLPPKA